MTTPDTKNLVPLSLDQNPSPVTLTGQDFDTKTQAQVDFIMGAFRKMLPSNYVSDVTGPLYSIQLQAIAEIIAKFQLQAQEIFSDNAFDYTRSEFLYQLIGSMVFPDGTIPDLEGDLSYRTFLQRMVLLLLDGSKPDAVKQGIELLTTATVEIIEKAVEARKLKVGSAWGPTDQFSVEINISQENGTVDINGLPVDIQRFPEDPFALLDNVKLVLRALKPGHIIYDYRHVFKEIFSSLFQDSFSLEFKDYHYQDFRKYWLGIKQITGTAGVTLASRDALSDCTRDFSSVVVGARLTILSGPNAVGYSATDDGHIGHFIVQSIQYFPFGNDPTPRPYTTSPTGLTGNGIVINGDTIQDEDQDWSLAAEDEILTFTSGYNVGSYRLSTALGLNGGPVGYVSGVSTKVRVSPSILKLDNRMKYVTTGQEYTVTVDDLGQRVPLSVIGEDVSSYFFE
jgi:hypothetical protein